jgi:hypothetical protein
LVAEKAFGARLHFDNGAVPRGTVRQEEMRENLAGKRGVMEMSVKCKEKAIFFEKSRQND